MRWYFLIILTWNFVCVRTRNDLTWMQLRVILIEKQLGMPVYGRFHRKGRYHMAEVTKIPFGVTSSGKPVDQYTLQSGRLSCDILTYGGALRSFRAPDRDGKIVDVLLGYDNMAAYEAQDKFMGALIGRFANRIGGAAFQLDGKMYQLAKNDGPNHLHGGPCGFDKQVWTVEDASADSLTLSLVSPDGQENYPGTLTVRVVYTLSETGLSIDYQARSDKDTLCNLTNHAYFNLSGHDSGPVLDQTIQIFAGAYTPTDSGSIPTGELAPVDGTPMDLRQPKAIGADIDAPFDQLTMAGGYDHNWVLTGADGSLRTAAKAYSPESGIELEVLTTLPAVQFYAGNYLPGSPAGKNGAPYDKRWGFCLESQIFPDAPHHDRFPSAVLRAGDTYHHCTVFRFSVR